jgi:DNA-binding protein
MSPDSGSDSEAHIKAAGNAISSAVFSGLSKNADWWQQVRNKTTKETEYRAFAVYTIETKTLDKQVAAYLQQFVDEKNKTMSEAEQAIYAKLIDDIMNDTGVALNSDTGSTAAE